MTDDGVPEWIRDYYDGDVPSVLEDPGGPIQFDGLDINSTSATVSDDLLEDHAQNAAESFAEYVIGEAGETITAGSLRVETIRDAIHLLEQNGYRTDGGDVLGFAHPEQFGDLREQWASMARVTDGEANLTASVKEIGVDGVDIHRDRSMPEGHGVVMHSDAAMPRPPEHALGPSRDLLDASLSARPWVIADPNGVVVIDTSE